MNGTLRALLVTTAVLPALCAAQGQPRPQSMFNYTYVELAYDESDYKIAGGGEIDGDGFTLAGSLELTEEWHAFATYGNADLDFGIDLDTWALGVGYAYPLRNDVDLYGRLLYVNTEADLPGPGDPDEDGLGLQARVRYRVNNELELEGGIQHFDVGDSDTSLQAAARYYFQDNFSVGVGLTFAGDADGIGVNVRFSF
jgi:hypothetical protein